MRVGDIDAVTADPIPPLTSGGSGVVLQNAERIWQLHEATFALSPSLGPRIFDYYFMRTAVQLIIGVLESRVDFSAVGNAMSVKLSQRIQAREFQIDRYTKEIERLETILTSFGNPVTGLITRIEPITPPLPGDISSPLAAVGVNNPYVFDSNDPRISGSPYWRATTNNPR